MGEPGQPAGGAAMILFLTTADTEVLALSRAVATLPDGFPRVRAANPSSGDPGEFVARCLAEEPLVVLVRLLGGRRAWREGFDRLAAGCAAAGVPLLAFGGEAEPDADLVAASTAPSGTVAEAFGYLRHGGVGNLANLLRFVADTLLSTGFGFEPPVELPAVGLYPTATRDRPEPLDGHLPDRPLVGVVFYRAHWMSRTPRSSTAWSRPSPRPAPTRCRCSATRCARSPRGGSRPASCSPSMAWTRWW